MTGWKKDAWICEDCLERGEDWGVPESCPSCQSANVIVLAPTRVQRVELQRDAQDLRELDNDNERESPDVQP